MTLRDLPWWLEAAERLRALHARHGDEARERAATFARTYQGKRAAMVFDVVASRQRRYALRVEPMLKRFAPTPAAASLTAFAEYGPGEGHGLRSGEAETMQAVARRLVTFSERHGLDDDEGSRRWAESAAPFEHAPRLEPYVGGVNGIGVALFAYLRMLSGADALKPDVRVHDALNGLGFRVPREEHAILVVAHAAAEEVGVTRLVLDQMLWYAPPRDRSHRGRQGRRGTPGA